MKVVSLIAVSLLLNGCVSGLGLNKKCTVVPDLVGVYYETGPSGLDREYNTIKIGSKAEWKFQ